MNEKKELDKKIISATEAFKSHTNTFMLILDTQEDIHIVTELLETHYQPNSLNKILKCLVHGKEIEIINEKSADNRFLTKAIDYNKNGKELLSKIAHGLNTINQTRSQQEIEVLSFCPQVA